MKKQKEKTIFLGWSGMLWGVLGGHPWVFLRDFRRILKNWIFKNQKLIETGLKWVKNRFKIGQNTIKNHMKNHKFYNNNISNIYIYMWWYLQKMMILAEDDDTCRGWWYLQRMMILMKNKNGHETDLEMSPRPLGATVFEEIYVRTMGK